MWFSPRCLSAVNIIATNIYGTRMVRWLEGSIGKCTGGGSITAQGDTLESVHGAASHGLSRNAYSCINATFLSLLSIFYKERQTYGIMFVCPRNVLWTYWYVSVKLCVNILPLEATPPLYFIIFYCQWYQHGSHMKFWSGSDSGLTCYGFLKFFMVIDLHRIC
jgi:hypothetical protein